MHEMRTRTDSDAATNLHSCISAMFAIVIAATRVPPHNAAISCCEHVLSDDTASAFLTATKTRFSGTCCMAANYHI